jgi:hypothetical protein
MLQKLNLSGKCGTTIPMDKIHVLSKCTENGFKTDHILCPKTKLQKMANNLDYVL